MWRSDLRYRVTSAKALTLITGYLAVLALVALLSLPPDLGRLDDLRQQGLVLAFLIVQSVLAAYLTSAAACGEIAVEGEKSVWDLAASPFPRGVIARGKALTAATYVALLTVAAAPFMLIVAGIRGEPLLEVFRAALVAVPFGLFVGTLGALYAGLFDSEFVRSLVHWVTLLALVVGATALPPPWDLLSPVRLIILAVRAGARPVVLLVILGYSLGAVLAAAAIARRVDAIRSEALLQG